MANNRQWLVSFAFGFTEDVPIMAQGLINGSNITNDIRILMQYSATNSTIFNRDCAISGFVYIFNKFIKVTDLSPCASN